MWLLYQQGNTFFSLPDATISGILSFANLMLVEIPLFNKPFIVVINICQSHFLE